MKRFTSSVCFNFLLLLLKVSFSLFVCSRQLVLKIWKVSDLYLYQVVQQDRLDASDSMGKAKKNRKKNEWETSQKKSISPRLHGGGKHML
jgi:hypothetical protein